MVGNVVVVVGEGNACASLPKHCQVSVKILLNRLVLVDDNKKVHFFPSFLSAVKLRNTTTLRLISTKGSFLEIDAGEKNCSKLLEALQNLERRVRGGRMANPVDGPRPTARVAPIQSQPNNLPTSQDASLTTSVQNPALLFRAQANRQTTPPTAFRFNFPTPLGEPLGGLRLVRVWHENDQFRSEYVDPSQVTYTSSIPGMQGWSAGQTVHMIMRDILFMAGKSIKDAFLNGRRYSTPKIGTIMYQNTPHDVTPILPSTVSPLGSVVMLAPFTLE